MRIKDRNFPLAEAVNAKLSTPVGMVFAPAERDVYRMNCKVRFRSSGAASTATHRCRSAGARTSPQPHSYKHDAPPEREKRCRDHYLHGFG
ncbi:MAG: hypothetical protein MSG64_16610 [Pyrinomonadaceae bacterium MAG19_C2-C3]|nr:hypothetical protein [Pyrinomonadaceae bacterium MAG19_C2-C3]